MVEKMIYGYVVQFGLTFPTFNLNFADVTPFQPFYDAQQIKERILGIYSKSIPKRSPGLHILKYELFYPDDNLGLLIKDIIAFHPPERYRVQHKDEIVDTFKTFGKLNAKVTVANPTVALLHYNNGRKDSLNELITNMKFQACSKEVFSGLEYMN